MKPILFTIALVALFSLLSFYISRRFISHLDANNSTKRYFNIFLVLNLFGIFLYVLGRYYIDMPNWLYFLSSIPIGMLFLLFCTSILYDILRVLLSRASLSKSRRDFFKRSLDVASLVVATSLTARGIYEARDIKHEKVDIKIKNLKKPYKIVQLSDIHIGGLIDKDFIHNIAKRVDAMDADLVVITGDLVDIDIQHASDALEELARLNSRYGTYFVVGNHEYFHNIEKIIAKVKSLGIRVLENENVYIGDAGFGFNLAGVYDVFGYRTLSYMPEIGDALKGKKDAPTILLAHQPRYIEEVIGGVDLMLSGHTHGGQLYPFKFLVKLQQPYISGLHQHNKELQIYVNKGTGFWGPPMRLGASSEITEIMVS